MDQVRKKLKTEYAYQRGLYGEGITIAVMDTGAVLHPDFDSRIIHFADFTQRRKKCYDDNSHGTHVLGIIGGSGRLSRGQYQGMAPKCKMVVLKVLDRRGNGNTEQVIEAIDYVIKNQGHFQIRILNISVGMLPDAKKEEQKNLMLAVERAWDAGIVVVAAAGNNGPGENSVTIPGKCKSIITVGSADDGSEFYKKGLPNGYSGRGPTDCCVVKPEEEDILGLKF